MQPDEQSERIVVDGRKVATVWTRGNGSLAIYAPKGLKVTGPLKAAITDTSEGTRIKCAADELGLATELVKLAADAVQAKPTAAESKPAPKRARARQPRTTATPVA